MSEGPGLLLAGMIVLALMVCSYTVGQERVRRDISESCEHFGGFVVDETKWSCTK